MSDSMDYEMLIRKAYRSGRYEHGGNADIYRRLEALHTKYQAKKSGKNIVGSMSLPKSLDEYALEYGWACGEVATYVKTAIKRVREGLYETGNEEKIEKLSNLEEELRNADLEIIGKVIEQADEVFMEIELLPG